MLDVLTVQFDSLSKPVDPKNKSANLEYLKLLSAKIFRKILLFFVFKIKWIISKNWRQFAHCISVSCHLIRKGNNSYAFIH